MKSSIIGVAAIFALAFSACTSYQEEEVPVSFSVNREELSFSQNEESQSVTVISGSKWDVTSMPSWISLRSINRSGVSPYEWSVDFYSAANGEYDRDGKIVFKSQSGSLEVSVIQEGKKGKYVAVESVNLSKTELTMTVGESVTLTYGIIPLDASIKDVSWESGSTTVATVSQSGQIDAISEGKTTITVKTKDGGKTASCTVTVKPVAVSSVTLDKETLSLKIGETYSLFATVLPESAANKKVSWSSSNKSVATVDETGKVTAVGVGSVKITVTTNDGGKTATCSVVVSPISVTGVSLNKASMSLTIGATEQLIATVTPSSAANKIVTWSSSNSNVATVDSNGNVSAIKVGTAIITATTEDGGKKATCSVSVNPVSVTGVSLNQTSLTMAIGDTQTLTATVMPSNATDKSVRWSSSNTSVATISSSGVVSAKSAGTATISVTTNDGAKKATCAVFVTTLEYIVDGINYGSGIVIDGVIWAPVNCGFDSNHIYGLLYQWGRKYGQSYNDGKSFQSEANPTFQLGPVTLETGESASNKNVFYYWQDYNFWWATEVSLSLWNSGTEDTPEKTQNDPCPLGWRVPTHTELSSLVTNHSQVLYKEGVYGMLFSGSSTIQSELNSVFLPLAGLIDYHYVLCRERNSHGFYWSSRASNYDYLGGVSLSFGVSSTDDSYVNPISDIVYSSSPGAYGFSVRCVKE